MEHPLLTDRVLATAFAQDRTAWPKAASGQLCIFEAIEIVGAALFESKWDGTEFLACWWSAEGELEAQQRFSHGPRGDGPPSSLELRRARQLDRPVETLIQQRHQHDNQRAHEAEIWKLNKDRFDRLFTAAERLAQKGRDGSIRSSRRSPLGGALTPIEPSDWNRDSPLRSIVANGGYDSYYLFVDQKDLQREFPNAPKPRWSDETMSVEIAECGIRNRERAWKEIFKPRQTEHGWSGEDFRGLWSEARGTKGLKGAPSKCAN